MCLDYRTLNKAITLRYPITRINDFPDALGPSTVSVTLDQKQRYHQIPLRESDIPLAASPNTIRALTFSGAAFQAPECALRAPE